jgi:hypothetical protein
MAYVERKTTEQRVFNVEQEVSNIQSQYRTAAFRKNAKYEFELKEFKVDGKVKKYLKAGGERYNTEVELAYLLLDITTGPTYIGAKKAQTCFAIINK